MLSILIGRYLFLSIFLTIYISIFLSFYLSFHLSLYLSRLRNLFLISFTLNSKLLVPTNTQPYRKCSVVVQALESLSLKNYDPFWREKKV